MRLGLGLGVRTDRSRGRPFNPADLLPAAWYAARLETPVSDGTAIVPHDWSGNGHHQVQATGTKQPLYKVGIVNSLPVFRFDGVDDFTKVSFTLSKPVTTFAVVKERATAPSDNAAFMDGGSFQTMAHFASTGLTPLRMYAGATLTIGTTDITAFHRYTCVWNGASSSGQIGDNSPVTGSAGAGTPGGVSLGMGGDGTHWPGAYDIAEVIVVNRVCTSDEIAATLAYLKSLYGL